METAIHQRAITAGWQNRYVDFLSPSLCLLSKKWLHLFRLGDSNKSMMKGVMFDTSTSSVPKVSTFRLVWSMTSVSLFFNSHGRPPNNFCRFFFLLNHACLLV